MGHRMGEQANRQTGEQEKFGKNDFSFSIHPFPHFPFSLSFSPMFPLLRYIMIIVIAFTLLACQKEPERRYDLVGTVVSVEPQHKLVTVKHDDIPGYMNAMTMPFSLKDEWVYQVMSAGDQIQAQLVVQGDRSWLEQVSVTRPPPPGEEPPPGEATKEFTPYPASDFTLTDQDGQPFSLHDLRGKTVFLDFIFTRCPGPCPLLSLKFSQVQQRLAERLGKDVFLLSVTIDPRHDTPEVLKTYAQRYNANLSGWKFLTGSTKDIILTTSAFGADYEANEDGIVDHRLVTCVINPDGTIVKEFAGTNYTVDDLLVAVEKQS